MIIDIGNDFFTRLLNRNKSQGDGKNTAIDFRNEYLTELDNSNWWSDESKTIKLDFKNVEVVGPSWANEIFAYYLRKNGNQ